MYEIPLPGCRAEPLASYLKSLAILRLLSEQKARDTRGFWRNGIFNLQSAFDSQDLVKFFVEEYVPTPMVSPWNGGSGFSEGDATEGMDAIRASTESRFADYRQTIESIFQWPEMPPRNPTLETMITQMKNVVGNKPGKANDAARKLIQQVEGAAAKLLSREQASVQTIDQLQNLSRPAKTAAKNKLLVASLAKDLLKPAKKLYTEVKKQHRAGGKAELVQACRDRLGDRALEWIDAAIVIKASGDPSFPPLLGTGGIEGRLEYTNTFMRCLATLLLKAPSPVSTEALLRNALFGEETNELVVSPVGQYYPGRAGGFNQGQGIETKDFPINPWDFVLILEGAIVWAAGLSRRYSAGGTASLSVPFTVRPRPVGYSSAVGSDIASARAEVWAPLWQQPTGYPELRTIFAEGRAEVGRKSAGNSIEFAEAAASLGVDRGITEFVRYSLIKRRGDSFVALPAGRFHVAARSESDLLRQLDPILDSVDRFFRKFPKSSPPARFVSARLAVDAAIYEVLLRGGAPRVKQLLAAIGRLERLFAERDLSKKPKLMAPLAGLKPAWIAAADDGSVEIRIAAALASISATGEVGPLRANLCPVEATRPYSWAKGTGQTSWSGHSLAARLAATLERRMMDAERLDCRGNPVWSSISICAEDALALVEGDVDESLVEDLLFGLSWINFRLTSEVRTAMEGRWLSPVESRIVPRAWCLLKLLFLPKGVPVGGVNILVRPERSILSLLRAGRVGDACRIACRRLYASGLAPVQPQFPDTADGTRLAASLLVPIHDVPKLVKRVLNVTPEVSLEL